MTPSREIPSLPWTPEGARLHLPRDLHLAYIVGRMGVATSHDLWPLLYGSFGAGKFGFARLQRLGLLRMFPRKSPSEIGWFGLAKDAASWVAESMGCEEQELRVVQGIARANLSAVRQRNRLWVSIVLACRARGDARLALARPEWELRALKGPGTRLVPDLQLVLEALSVNGAPYEVSWFVELDNGTERALVWDAKVRAYAEARRSGPLFGEGRWQVLAVVPSIRRAQTVAVAAAKQGAGGLFWVALHSGLENGAALEARAWRADELAQAPRSQPRWSLLGTSSPSCDAELRPRAAADRGAGEDSPEVSP